MIHSNYTPQLHAYNIAQAQLDWLKLMMKMDCRWNHEFKIWHDVSFICEW